MASRKLQDLDPAFRELVIGWLADCHAAKLDILVYRTHVPNIEQAEAYKVGRTKKGEGVTEKRPMGRIITRAKPGQSAHNYGLAIDFVPMVAGKPQWTAPSKATKLGEARGMESLRPFEWAHLQIAGFDWREYMK
jgi:peptidoglycan LD-endopeptidase CwlK